MTRNWIKKALISGAILLGFCVALVVSLSLYLNTNHAKKFVEARLSAAIPGSITFEAMHLSLWRGQAELKSLVLTGLSHEAIAGFDRLFVNLAWGGFLGGGLTIETLLLEKPWAEIRATEDGVNLLKALTPPSATDRQNKEESTKGMPLNFVVQSFEILGGRAVYHDPSAPLVASLQDISLMANGDMLQKSGSLDLRVAEMRLEHGEINSVFDEVTLKAKLEERHIAPVQIKIAMGSSKLNIAGSVQDVFDDPTFDMVTELAVFLPDLQERLPVKPRLAGSAKGRMTLQGTLSDPRITFHLDCEGGRFGEVRMDRLTLDCSLKDRLLVLKSLWANTAGGNVEGEDFRVRVAGECDLSSERIAGRLSLESPDITHAFSSRGVAEVSGGMSLEAEVSGLLRRPQAHLVFDGTKMRFQDYGIGDVRLAGTLDPSGTFRLAELRLKNQGSRIEGHGSVGIYDKTSKLSFELPLNLSLALHSVELTDFVKETLARGALDGEVMVSGSLNELKGQAHIRGKHLAVQALRLGDLYGKIGLDKGRLNIQQLDLQNKDSAIRIAGAIGLFHREGLQIAQDPTFELRIQGDRVFVNDFIDKSRGRLAIAANLEGSLSNPKGSLSLEGTELDFGVQKLEGLELLATLDGKRLLIKPLRLTVVPGEMIEANGWMSLNKDYDLALVSRGISLEHIDLFDKRVGAKGSLICDLSGSGSWKDPQLHGKMVLQRFEFRSKPLEDIHVAVNMENQVARISARQRFDLQGTFHLKNQDFTVSLLLDETDLAPYFGLADASDFSGVVTGSVEAKGNTTHMADVETSLDLKKLHLLWKDKDLIRTEGFQAFIKERHLSLPQADLVLGSDGQVSLKGSAALDGNLAIQAKGEIPLATLRPFIDDVIPDLGGRLVLAASLEGSSKQPRIHGDVVLDQVSCIIPGLFQKLDGVTGQVRITPERIVVDRLQGKLDGGKFNLEGKMDMDSFTPTGFFAQFKTEALPIRLPDTMDLLLKTDLRMEGDLAKALIEGEVFVLEGNYYKDVRLSLLDEVTRRREETVPQEASHPFYKNTSLDVSVKRRNAITVDNNLAQLAINPDLRIVGSLANPIIRGRATVESGTITYRNKTFEVKKGYVDFSNPYITEPYIDIESDIKVRQWTIRLVLAGMPEALSLKLTSDPPEEDGDILSLLVIGRTTKELIAGEGGAGKTPAQLLADAMAKNLGDEVKEITGLDAFEVKLGTENGADNVTVSVGKDLSKRMSIKYATESKDGSIVQRAIAEYKFLEHILFSGSQDSEGVFGGEVKFRLEFR